MSKQAEYHSLAATVVLVDANQAFFYRANPDHNKKACPGQPAACQGFVVPQPAAAPPLPSSRSARCWGGESSRPCRAGRDTSALGCAHEPAEIWWPRFRHASAAGA